MFALAPVAAFLAQTPSWTDKEVLTIIVSIVVGLLGFFGLILKFATSRAKNKAKQLELKKLALEGQIQNLVNSVGVETLQDVKAKLDRTREEAEEHQEAAETLKSETVEHQANLSAAQRRIQRTLSKDGQTWNERVLSTAPDFKPLALDGRRMPVISVLNLKGGVGKTTTTANLGAALDSIGYRVLMIDLDLQGSLTDLFLPEHEKRRLDEANVLLADFLANSYDADNPNLLDYISSVLPDQKSGLVPTGDNLAYAETNLTVRWLLKENRTDPRFLLRKALRYKRITNNYDLVLMDCPPIFNMCCVNALAASDYLLIPILPSKQSTSRVPVLLKRLQEFRENINPDLKILGILANRTMRSELTYDEQNRLSALQNECKDVWGTEVPLLETFIRQTIEIRTAEDENRPLLTVDDTFHQFEELAQEVMSLLPSFCRAAAREVAS